MNLSSTLNTERVKHAKDTYEQCFSDYTSLRYSLEGWVNNGQTLPLNNSTCSNEEQQQLMSTIGDINLVRSEAMALTEEYSKNSQSTVSRIATYAKIRSTYDQGYLNNHTQEIQDLMHEHMTELQERVPDIDIDGLFDQLLAKLDEAMSCISPRNPSEGICASVTGVYDMIDDAYVNWSSLAQVYMEQMNEMYVLFSEYKQNVIAAYEISSGFYYSKLISFPAMQ